MALLALLAGGGCDGRGAHDAQRNILFIMTEDQGAHAGFLGTRALETPNMDRLARTGVGFTRSFVAYPVCSASKAGTLTGLYALAHGIQGNTLDYMKPAEALTEAERQHPMYRMNRVRPEVPTLIEVLREAGYVTGVVRKLNLAPMEKFPFDEFIAKGSAQAVTRFIGSAEATGAPFFLLYNIQRPHRPFRNSDIEPIGVNPAAVDLPGFLPDTPVARQDWAEYLDAIELADAELGHVLRGLEASGRAADTLVVFAGDHGPSFQRGKMSVYDLGLRVPLAVSGPGVAGGRTLDALVSNIDLMPTLLEMVDLPVPDGVRGVSFAPLLRGTGGGPRQYVFAEVAHGGAVRRLGLQERSVFDGEYHLIVRDQLNRPRMLNKDISHWERWRNRSYAETLRAREAFPEPYRLLAEFDASLDDLRPRRVELYRTGDDPDELHDLAADPAHRAARERLMARLRTWAETNGDRRVRYPVAAEESRVGTPIGNEDQP